MPHYMEELYRMDEDNDEFTERITEYIINAMLYNYFINDVKILKKAGLSH